MAHGKDVAALLPYLSRYMDDATFQSTYYYIHTSRDLMSGFADTTAGACLLPGGAVRARRDPHTDTAICSVSPGTTCTPICPGPADCLPTALRPLASTWSASRTTLRRSSVIVAGAQLCSRIPASQFFRCAR
jgi:hypothetical protein